MIKRLFKHAPTTVVAVAVVGLALADGAYALTARGVVAITLWLVRRQGDPTGPRRGSPAINSPARPRGAGCSSSWRKRREDTSGREVGRP